MSTLLCKWFIPFAARDVVGVAPDFFSKLSGASLHVLPKETHISPGKRTWALGNLSGQGEYLKDFEGFGIIHHHESRS